MSELLEKVEKLGNLGDTVTVKPGYGRNYLLPTGKALRATKDNIAYFESEKETRLANNEKERLEAEKLKDKINGKQVVIIRAASESAQLYGSVTARDIANAVSEGLAPITRHDVVMENVVKTLGIFDFRIRIHPEVHAMIKVNVAKSDDEAKLQADRVAKGLPAIQLGEQDDRVTAKQENTQMSETKADDDVEQKQNDGDENIVATEDTADTENSDEKE